MKKLILIFAICASIAQGATLTDLILALEKVESNCNPSAYN